MSQRPSGESVALAALRLADETIATADARTCRRCLREGRPSLVDDATAQDCPRCHSALKGNSKTKTNGFRSRPELHPETAALFLDRVRAVVTDAGHTLESLENPPAYAYASQVRDYVRLELLIESGFVKVVERGASSKVIDQLVTIIGTKARLAAQIGLERRSKPATSPLDYLAGKVDA